LVLETDKKSQGLRRLSSVYCPLIVDQHVTLKGVTFQHRSLVVVNEGRGKTRPTGHAKNTSISNRRIKPRNNGQSVQN
jgi:hypothetical protein